MWVALFLVIGFDVGAFVSGNLYWLADVWTWDREQRLALITAALFLTVVGLALPFPRWRHDND